MTKEEIEYAKSCILEIRNWGDTETCCYDLDTFIEQVKKLQQENETLKSKANKWDRITSGVYFKDGKQRSKWCLKIKNQYDWISYLSILREGYKQDESELLRVVNHLDCQVLIWALDSLKEEVMRYKND